MTVRRFVVPVTVDGNGDAEKISPVIYGNLVSITYLKTDYDAGVDFVITTEDTGQTLWAEDDVDLSAVRYPRAPTHTTAGAASLYVALGAAVNSQIAISAERIKIVVASGGDGKTGAFHFTIRE